MRYWNPEIETMDVSTMKSMQERKLRNMVRLAYHHSPFYRLMFKEHKLSPLDIKSFDDLKKIPFTKKENLIEQPKDFILQPTEVSLKKTLPTSTKLRAVFYDKLMSMKKVTSELKEEYKPVMFVVSSGRASGMPTPVFYTKKDLDIFAECGARIGVTSGGTEDSIFHIAFPAGLHMAFWQCVAASDTIGALSIRFGAGMTDKQVLIIDKFGVTDMVGVPTYTKHLSEAAVRMKEEGHDISFENLKHVLCAGERFPEGMKKKIQNNLQEVGADCKILEGYGSSECKTSFVECNPKSGFHLHPDVHIWEILDEKTLEPVGEGERGVLAFTHIDFRGTIFLRFLTHDVAENGILYEKCECGRTSPRIMSPIGRMSDYSTKIDIARVKGTNLDLNALDDLLSEIQGLEVYQAVITRVSPEDPYSLDALIVKAGIEKGREKEIEKQIKSRVKNIFEITPDVEYVDTLVLEDELVEKWKALRVVDIREM
ncbi:MAG: AMP-binding protein [Theionarchaea archaeon]|nr:AMP-binding protein [Theionarchaea archaeon]